MGAQKKKAAKFLAKGHLSQKLKKRNDKRKLQAMKDKRKKNRVEKGELSDLSDKRKKQMQGHQTNGETIKKGDTDMMDEMDVDDFLNGDFLDSDAEPDFGEMEEENPSQEEVPEEDEDSSSEEEDESALDPRYMSGLASEVADTIGADLSDDEEDDEDQEDNANGEEDEDKEEEEEKESVLPARTTLTMEMLAKMETAAFEKCTAGGVRKMIKVFSDACRSSDAADADRGNEIMYDIDSSAVYNRLMLNVFRKSHIAFTKLVCVPSASTDEAQHEEEHSERTKIDERKWKKHALLLRRFFTCVCYLLQQTTARDIQLFVVRELAHYVDFLLPCEKTAHRVLKTLLKVWSKTLNTNLCMLAFVRIRDLAIRMPFPFLELCLKGIYLAYMRNTKFTNEATQAHHILMGNCVVELFGVELSSSYQHAFIYIRQLAVAIRKTITSPSPDSFKAVLNWQFFNQLRVWTAVLCAYPGDAQLKPLVYPLCQLLFATIRLASTIRYAPLRFHCVKLLQQLAFATNSFVPTSPVLLELLKMAPFSTSYKGQKGKVKSDNTRLDVDLDLCVKLSKSTLENKRVHDLLMTRLFELLQRECDVYKFNIGFPEFAVPLTLTLTKYASTCKIPRWKALSKGMVDNLKKRADWIRTKRAGLDISPKDVNQVDAFLKQEREAAVQRAFASDVEDLKKRMETQPDDVEDATKMGDQGDSDSEMEDATDEVTASVSENEEEQAKPAKKTRRGTKGKHGKFVPSSVDDQTFAKVKSMSLQEFRSSVAAIDQDDTVQDFAFSDEDM